MSRATRQNSRVGAVDTYSRTQAYSKTEVDDRIVPSFLPLTIAKNHPRATNATDTPIFRFADSTATGIYWPFLVDERPFGGTGWALYYSTDHESTHANSGCYVARAATPFGPFVEAGKVFRYDGGGQQTETPSVVWDEAYYSGGTSFTVDSAGVFTRTSHGLDIGRSVDLTGLTGASGFATSTIYYVATTPTANTFTLAATRGGSAITTTTSGSGSYRYSGRWILYCQQDAVGRGAQSTIYATALKIMPGVGDWTYGGLSAQMRSLTDPGDGHSGYLKPFDIAGRHYAYSLYGGTDNGAFALWRSEDRVTWELDSLGQLSLQKLLLRGIRSMAITGTPGSSAGTSPAYTASYIWKGFLGFPFTFKGQTWWIGLCGPRGSGGAITANQLVAGPLREDLRGLAEPGIDITPAWQSWMTAAYDYLGNLVEYDGQMYGVFRANGKTGSFGLVRMF